MDRVNSVQELIERTQNMPLDRMRFFINQNRGDPRCFGIYQDMASGYWVVYKNKGDGSRAVRYNGPDEGYAANEIWQKIQSEIDKRRPAAAAMTAEKRRLRKIYDILIVLVIIAIAIVGIYLYRHSPRRGYYRVDDDVYYYQGSSWYWFVDDGWERYDAPDDSDWYEDHYYGESYPYFEDSRDAFEYSDYYVEPSSDDDDSDIFDSWDSSDTDWDSDW